VRFHLVVISFSTVRTLLKMFLLCPFCSTVKTLRLLKPHPTRIQNPPKYCC